MIAKEAQASGASVYDLVLKSNLLTQTELEKILAPGARVRPQTRRKN